ncbi:MAG: M20/M25/M40 family metallo-hydrolase [Candidatus Eisenbacteria bacterium]
MSSTSVRLGLAVLLLSALHSSASHARSISTPSDKSGAPVTRGKRAADPLGALNSTEKKVVAAVDRAVPAALALLERTVNVNSGTMNFAGVREVGKIFEPEFAALGFTTEWVDGASWGRAGHLMARRSAGDKSAAVEKATAQPARGRPGVRGLNAGSGASSKVSPSKLPRVLLIGHLDTVFEKDSPFQRFERLSDSTARAPGSCDMKGGITVMLVALKALGEAGALDRLAVQVYLGGDEEKSGNPHALSRRHLRDAAEWADVAIGFEDGAGDPRYAVVARRGASGWQLDVAAKPYHSGQIFREDIGSGAVFEAARILEAFRDSLAGERYLTFNPGVILGGTAVSYDSLANRGTAFGKANVIAERTVVAGDLRAISAAQRDAARATMRRIAAASLPHARADLTFDDGYPPLAPSDGNRRLLAIYDRASRDLGLGGVEGVDPSRAGAADVSFCDGLVDMAMDGVGLMGDGGHTVEETADLRTLPTQAKRMGLTLLRLAEGWGGR